MGTTPQPFRTAAGGRVDRARPLDFSFDGRRLTGLAGDTLASALLANGIHLVARSFKYHRPRGIMGAGSEEPSALVTIDRGAGRTTPNLRATEVELYAGLVARSQNCWPSLGLDLGEVADTLSPLLAAGFYYRTFMGPRRLQSLRLWPRVFEPLIRRAAGLGRAPAFPDPDHYASRFAHCDVLVVGAGPAGLAAALAAADTGARVILCDEQAEMGGTLLAEAAAAIETRPAAAWLAEALGELGRNPRVELLARTQCFGLFADGFAGLAQRLTDHLAAPPPELARERLWQVRARRIVLATGAIERPLVFPDNDRPGIMLAGAASTYVRRYGVRPGTRAVVATACDTGYGAAIALQQAGAERVHVLDLRAGGNGRAAGRAAGESAAPALGPEIVAETVERIVATRGRRRVASVVARGSASSEIACDLLLMAGGFAPNVALHAQARGRLNFDDARGIYVPAEPVGPISSAGAANGTFGLAAALDEGYAVGHAAARAAGRVAVDAGAPCNERSSGPLRRAEVQGAAVDHGGATAAAIVPPARGKAFVDFQNDVTTKDLALAAREGFRSIEHVKRYTTTGMATDQGKTSSLNALAVVAHETGRAIPEVGLTTFRRPYTPVTFGTLAGFSRGDLFDPIRTTPMHDALAGEGAVFEDVGLWKRPRYVARAGEDMHRAVARECRTVRSAVGLLDASTLGKIEVVGPDAAEFLERMYVNAFHTLPVGRCRYGVLLSEAGFVIDDGVIGRLAQGRFHITTTTGGAARVLHMLEDYAQTEHPELRVFLTSTTEQWAVVAVQGPRARETLAPLVEGIDITRQGLPHMGLAEGRICGVPCRLFRVSFTGEAGFEVNVPADWGEAVWHALLAEARKHGGAPYGTEAMHVLRAEKGFIIVGQETDGTVTPDDLGLGWAIGKAKRDFVGKRALARPDLVRAGRRQLVGLLTADAQTLLEEGAQVTTERDPAPGTAALGHVTSAYASDAVGRPIALALVAAGRRRIGSRLFVPMPSGGIEVDVVAPVFLDAKGERLHA